MTKGRTFLATRARRAGLLAAGLLTAGLTATSVHAAPTAPPAAPPRFEIGVALASVTLGTGEIARTQPAEATRLAQAQAQAQAGATLRPVSASVDERRIAGASRRRSEPGVAASTRPAPKAAEPEPPRLKEGRPGVALRVEDNHLTLETRDAPLKEVLLAISEAAGFEAALSGNLTAPVEASFSRLPVNEALNRLLRGLTHAERYAPSEPGRTDRRVVETWVLGPRGPIVSSPPVIGNTPDADAPGT